MEVDGWDPSLEEELGVSLDELRKWIEEAVEKSEIVQKKRAQLSELQQLVEKKEEEEAQTESLLIDARQYAARPPRSSAVGSGPDGPTNGTTPRASPGPLRSVRNW